MPQLAGKQIGSTGYGLMGASYSPLDLILANASAGLTWRETPVPHEQAFKAMKAAIASGANFWNGGELYGPPDANSLQLLNAYFSKYPEDADKVVISIKGGLVPGSHKPDGSAKNVRRSVEECLRVLDGKKKLDLFECARVDPDTPIEETVETLAQYIKEGKLGGISLSECSADSIRRAAAVHKIDAVEVEFSMFSTEILTNGVAQACAEHNIALVAYSPFSRGFLTGQLKSRSQIPAGDFRLRAPRFQEGAFEENLKLVDEVDKLAKQKGCTTGQIALAWIKKHTHRNGLPEFIPIPGATTAERVEENGKDVDLTEEDMNEIQEFIDRSEVAGARYPEAASYLNFGDSKKRS